MWLLLIFLGTTVGSQVKISSDLFLNKLNMSYGINYKYNGLLHHNIHRVWIITKVVVPKLDDVKFPDIKFDPDCSFLKELKYTHTHVAKHVNNIRSICQSMKPLITLLKQKELYYEKAITNILKEEIPRSLHGSGYSHTGRTFQDPVSAGQRFSRSTMGETPVRKKKALAAFLPVIAGLATIAVESLNSFLQRKRNKAMASGMIAIKEDQTLAWNSLKQLEDDFLMYGKYNVAQLQDIVGTVNGLQNKTMQLEKLLTGKDLQTLQMAHMIDDVSGRMTFIHKMNLYVHSVLERQIRLYEWLLINLKDLLNAIGILSTGHLPPFLFPPTVLENITTNALAMVKKTHPNFVLAIKHLTEYYDMKLATFGVDTEGNMIIAFPVFVQDHTSQPQTLYEIETVKVPIHDLNVDANSYSEVRYSKPYIAINKDYYIQLRIQELRMCKQIRHTYYCEELFLVKHKSKHSCESALYYKLSKEIVYSVCTFDYYYNTTVTPSVLDGGTHILLANMLSPKRLVCSQDLHMAHPVPSYPYVLVNRSLLCNCHLESGLTYLLESVGSCSPKPKFVMYFTINSAFSHFMSLFGLSETESISTELIDHDHTFDIFLNNSYPSILVDNSSMSIAPLSPPTTLLKLFQTMNLRAQSSQNSPFFPIVRHTSENESTKGSFLYSTPAHIFYMTTSLMITCIIIPQVYLACKHKKLHQLIAAMTLQRLPGSEAMSAFEIPNSKEAKLICQDPWVSIAITVVTIVGVVIYLYRTCSKMTFFKGYLYDNVCTVYLFISHDCYHVPLKLRELNGSLHTFTLHGQPKAHNMTLLKHSLWDTLHIKWTGSTLNMNDKRIDLPENINVPLWDKIKVRALMSHDNAKYNIMVKQGNTWYAPRNEARNVPAISHQEV